MKKHILLVDDEPWQLELYNRKLSEIYSVQAVSHAYAAIDQIDVHRPDVIVLDVLLAGSTVWTLLHELQSHHDLADIPVILASNTADTISLKDAQPYGVTAILDKTTMHPDDILNELEKALS